MTPAVKAFVKALIDHYEARITELESKISKAHAAKLLAAAKHSTSACQTETT